MAHLRKFRFLAPTAIISIPVLALGGLAPAEAHHGHGHGQASYSWVETPTGSTDQFRGLAAVSKKVAWVSGEVGTVLRTKDGGKTWKDVSPDIDGLELRDIEAWDSKHAITLSIGTGEASQILSTSDGGQTWKQRFVNDDPNAFYDCMAFNHWGVGLAMSDPVDGYFRIAKSTDWGKTWTVQSTDGMPAAEDGEFGFAASGTCLIATGGRSFSFASGGFDVPRVFNSTDNGETWTATDVPMRGGPAAGIYSLAAGSPWNVVAVGGDYTAPTDGSDASAYLSHGTWHTSPTPVGGYRSGAAFVPWTWGDVIAVGPTGSDVSHDGGRTWTTFDDGYFDGIECAWDGACWGSGTDGKVAKLVAKHKHCRHHGHGHSRRHH